MSAAPPVYAQARAETAAMLGYDLANLTAEQATRLDVAAALRLAVDDQSGKLARGETADVTRLLSASEALAKLLPPLREPPPASDRIDPRKIMLDTYMGMRHRGELADARMSSQRPPTTFEGRGRRIAELKARVAELEAAGVPAITCDRCAIEIPREPGEPTAPSNVEPLARPPTERTSLRNEVSPSPPAAPPKPAPQPQAAPTGILTDGGGDESWRPFVGGGAHYDRWSNRN